MTGATRLVAIALCAGAAAAASADGPSDAPAPVPQESFLSSLKQAFKEDFDHEVIRGHFDVGAAAETRRYYCLVDVKTGRREPKAVTGEPLKRADGMTGIKASAVSLYGCDSAEQSGILVTTGYVLPGVAPGAAGVRPEAPRAAADTASVRPDVGGVRLGMSVDEVRAVLRARRLADYYEATDRLWPADSEGSGAAPRSSGRFVNLIAAWSAATDAGTGEVYRVLFTPVPGQERVMAIVHVSGFAKGAAVRESRLNQALLTKYGGAATAEGLPAAATWRIQTGGEVSVGDACDRRPLFGAASDVRDPTARVDNPALQTTPDEFRHQIEHCGAALVTADHETVDGAERLVSRLMVTAYSPTIAFEGATAAAQLMQAVGGEPKVPGVHPAAASFPNL